MTTAASNWLPAQRHSAALDVYLLGLVDFDAAWAIQQKLVTEIAERNDTKGALILCEHPPIITIGREGSREHIAVPPEELHSRQIGVRWLNRGGGTLVHAPGQLAVYPILPLTRLDMSIPRIIETLLGSIQQLCQVLQLPTEILQAEPGIRSRCGQIANIGMAMKSWITYYGLYVNVAPDVRFLRLVNSGHADKASSIATSRMRRTPMHTVRSLLIENLVGSLGYNEHQIYTGHPLLRRTRKHICVQA